MRRLLVVAALVAAFGLGAQRSYAQNFYFNPQQTDQIKSILQFFGSVAGGALAHSGKVHGLGHADLDLHTVVVIVPDEFKSLPQFQGVDFVPIPMLQVGLGLPGNIEVVGRAFRFPLGSDPTKATIPGYLNDFVDSREAFTLLGGAVKYGVLQMFGLPKIMLLGAYHIFLVPQQFDFGDISNLTGQVYVSYGLGILAPYAAASVNYARFKVATGDRQTFTSTLLAATVGVEIKPIPLFHISADYNFSKFPNIGVSAGFNF